METSLHAIPLSFHHSNFIVSQADVLRLFVPAVGPGNNLLLVFNLINVREEAALDYLDVFLPCSVRVTLILGDQKVSPH